MRWDISNDDLSLIVDSVDVYLFSGLGGIKTIYIKRVFERVDQFFKPTAPGLVTDDCLSVLRGNNEANKRQAKLGFVIIYYFLSGKIGVKSLAIDAFSIGGLSRN